MFARNTLIKGLMRMGARPTMVANARVPLLLCQAGVRNFSSEHIERAAQKLNKALDSEVKYETENYRQLDDIETFLNESGFVFHETNDGLTMTLTKEVGDKHVEIIFEAR